MRTIQAGAVLALIAFWSGAGAACELPASSFIPFTPVRTTDFGVVLGG